MSWNNLSLSSDDSFDRRPRKSGKSSTRRRAFHNHCSLPLDRLVNVLEQRKGDEGVIDRWNQVAKSEPEKALHVLDAFANQGNFAQELWSSTIFSIRQSTTTAAQKDQLLDLIDKVPPQVVESMLWEVGELLQGWSGDGRQLARANGQPTVLFLARTHMGAGRESADAALAECFRSPTFSGLSGVVLSDSYRLHTTSWRPGVSPDVPLTVKEAALLQEWYGVR